tara:strand:- start:193 stop:543 length:351 start_codon:yes stop_codon:yes gene_type:complete
MSTESIPVTMEGKVAIVTAPGYVNEKIAEAISEECNSLIDGGICQVLIDMKECRMVNSVGVAIIIEIIELLGEQEGSLAFCNLDETIGKTFQIMGLKELAKIYGDPEEALAGFSTA